ncbi:MAG: hypothetical protein R3Y33_04930 [Clostridia bacterium]
MKKRLLAIAMFALMTVGSACQATPESSSSESSTSSTETSESTEVDTNMDGDVQLSEPGEFPIVIGEPVTLSVFASVHLDKNSEFDSSENTYTAWLEEKLNINLDWQITTASDKTAKLNLLFTSNDYQDIIFGSYWPSATQYSYGLQGFLVPLTDYYETDAYYFDQYVENAQELGMCNETTLQSLVMPDGNIYSLFDGMVSNVHVTTSTRMWIYTPWLDALDLEMPTTTDEYYDVLTAFKEDDPNGNGIADEIPLAGAMTGWNLDPTEFIMNSFVYYQDSDRMYIEDGEIVMSYSQDEFKDGLEYMRLLVDDGLLYGDTFIQDKDALRSLTSGDIQVVGSTAGGMQSGFTTNVISGEAGDWTNWKTIAPLEGPDGVQYAKYTANTAVAGFNITDACEYPRVAFRFGDSLYETEISLNAAYGADYWEWAEEGTVDGLGTQAEIVYYDTGSDTNFAWNDITITSSACPGILAAITTEDFNLDIEGSLYVSYDAYKDYLPSEDMIVPPLTFDEDEAERVTDLTLDLDSAYESVFVDFLYNTPLDELDARWEEFQQTLINCGIEEYLELYQTAYDAQY